MEVRILQGQLDVGIHGQSSTERPRVNSGGVLNRALPIQPEDEGWPFLCNPGAACFVTTRDFPILLALGSDTPTALRQRGLQPVRALQWDGYDDVVRVNGEAGLRAAKRRESPTI